jgi:hypothetical protein
MRLLRPFVCACAIGPLALAAGTGLFVGSMMCVAVSARNRISRGAGVQATSESETAAARRQTAERAATPGARRRRRVPR